APAQSLDYITVQKSNGKVLKKFYSGSFILLQLQNGNLLQGPIQTIRNDSVYLTLYDIRYYSTQWGTYMRDTISAMNYGINYHEIARVYLNRKQGFFQRNTGRLLMLASAGYLVLNTLNGNFFEPSAKGSVNLQKIGIAAGVFGLGYLLNKLLVSDGFNKKSHRIVYVDL
ncbi:MAG TPA: hypothetical protein VFL47_02295, partial [Flavisolibacter sp.]|nr:hypothetical protein [Flavisolibacter sp.]